MAKLGNTNINGALQVTGSTTLSVPLPISCGGTGATTAENALLNLNGISIKKIWENPDVSVAFPSQTLDNVDITGYDILIVITAYSIGYGTGPTGVICIPYGEYITMTGPYILTRTCGIVNNKISFGPGYIYATYGNSPTVDNNRIIPRIIYGIKGVK